jgi:hypothetical protein
MTDIRLLGNWKRFSNEPKLKSSYNLIAQQQPSKRLLPFGREAFFIHQNLYQLIFENCLAQAALATRVLPSPLTISQQRKSYRSS